MFLLLVKLNLYYFLQGFLGVKIHCYRPFSPSFPGNLSSNFNHIFLLFYLFKNVYFSFKLGVSKIW